MCRKYCVAYNSLQSPFCKNILLMQMDQWICLHLRFKIEMTEPSGIRDQSDNDEIWTYNLVVGIPKSASSPSVWQFVVTFKGHVLSNRKSPWSVVVVAPGCGGAGWMLFMSRNHPQKSRKFSEKFKKWSVFTIERKDQCVCCPCCS